METIKIKAVTASSEVEFDARPPTAYERKEEGYAVNSIKAMSGSGQFGTQFDCWTGWFARGDMRILPSEMAKFREAFPDACRATHDTAKWNYPDGDDAKTNRPGWVHPQAAEWLALHHSMARP